MGMVLDYELTASCLAGGLGGTQDRLEKTIKRLCCKLPQDVRKDFEKFLPDCRSPSSTAAIILALRDLTDVCQGLWSRSGRFRDADRHLSILKDKVLDSLRQNPAFWPDYHRLAQYLDILKLDYSQENRGLLF